MREYGTTPERMKWKGFEYAELPGGADAILDRISVAKEVEWEIYPPSTRKLVGLIGGFEDLLRGQVVGEGRFYNCFGNAMHLAFALSLAPQDMIEKILASAQTPAERVARMRKEQVLKGFRFLDLGAGAVPSFAIATHALGAEAYTADAIDLHQEPRSLIDGHVQVDLNAEEAITKILKVTNGNIDLVTENILDLVPGDKTRIEVPSVRRLVEISSTVLKRGGYLYSTKVDSWGDRVLRKI
jgi:hypothetical protein